MVANVFSLAQSTLLVQIHPVRPLAAVPIPKRDDRCRHSNWYFQHGFVSGRDPHPVHDILLDADTIDNAYIRDSYYRSMWNT
jgi:hypothetical protein